MFRRPISAALALFLMFTSVAFSQDAADTKPRLDFNFEKEKPQQKTPQFMRVVRDKDGTPIAFQTATIRYTYRPTKTITPVEGKPKDAITVDVIGVVHIGEKGYYVGLNRQFKQYDSLCYELVAPKGTKVPRGGRKEPSDNPMAIVQELMKSFLQLEHQLSIVDYHADNFVHADMSPAEMKAAQAKRGDNQQTIMMSMLTEMMRKQNLAAQQAQNGQQAPGATLTVGDLFNPLKLKRMMAEQFDQVGKGGKGSGMGAAIDQVLITDRNKAALKVVGTELNKGKRNVGLFYGAAHGPDFHKRLVKFGFVASEPEWRTAWNLSGGLNEAMGDLQRYQDFKKAVKPIEDIRIK